ncbi:hypothetical protein F5Y06DRAFT_56204 [Hypoxylon sp. FL0890]|nr:hypothetical protein F5Y06DRAFT_56204 [Hypoxylon sp. FL0890]
MAPVPGGSDDHYNAAVPLDGGMSPADLGGSSKHFPPTGLEIGIIIGVIVLVLISVVGIFLWRSRKNNQAKNADATSAEAGGAAKEGPEQGAGEATSRPKDDLTSAVKNDDLSSLEHPAVPDRVVDYYGRTVPKIRVREQGVEEHEIANRA